MTITAFPLNSGPYFSNSHDLLGHKWKWGLVKLRPPWWLSQDGCVLSQEVFFSSSFFSPSSLFLSRRFLRGGRSPQVFRAPERTVKNSEILRESDSFWRQSGFFGGSAPWLTNQRVAAAAAAAENLRPKWYLDAAAAGGDDISDDISEPLPRRSAHNRGRLQPSIRAVFIILAHQAPHAILLSHTVRSLPYELSILFVFHSI